MRLCVDIGHGGPGDRGAPDPLGETDEAALVTRLGLVIADRLIRLGHIVTMTRTRDDCDPSQVARARTAREWQAELSILVHVNAQAGGGHVEHGALVFWDPISPASARYATRIAMALAHRGGEYVEGGRVRPMLSHTIKARIAPHWTGRAFACLAAHCGRPAVLIEPGYLSHPHDRAWLVSDEGQRQIADAVAGALDLR